MNDYRDDGQLKLVVTRQELLDHCLARATYHQERAAKWLAEAERNETDAQAQLSRADTVTDRLNIKGSSSFSNVVSARESATQKASHHANKGKVLMALELLEQV
jgi:hypothetical protein